MSLLQRYGCFFSLVWCLENRIHQTHRYQGRHGDFIDGLGKFHAQTLLLVISCSFLCVGVGVVVCLALTLEAVTEKRATMNQ